MYTQSIESDHTTATRYNIRHQIYSLNTSFAQTHTLCLINRQVKNTLGKYNSPPLPPSLALRHSICVIHPFRVVVNSYNSVNLRSLCEESTRIDVVSLNRD